MKPHRTLCKTGISTQENAGRPQSWIYRASRKCASGVANPIRGRLSASRRSRPRDTIDLHPVAARCIVITLFCLELGVQAQTWPSGRLLGLRATPPAATQVLSDHHPYRGVNHDEPFELRTTLAELGNYPTSHKICLAPQLGGSKQLPLFEEGELPSEVVRQHYDRSLPPAVYIYGLKGHELGGAGFLHSGGRVFLAPDVMPAYFGQRLRDDGHSLDECQRGALFREDVITINLDGPVASVLHPNLVYGHFLLEIFPKLHLLSRLRAAGLVFPSRYRNRYRHG